MPRTFHYRSKALTTSQVEAAIAAHAHAEEIGCPLNLALDIHWQFTRFAGRLNQREAIGALRRSLFDFMAHRGVRFCWILVRESHPPYGEHCHILIHAPGELHKAVTAHVRDFLRGGKRHQKRALYDKATYNGGKLAYMLKGCTPHARPLLDQFNQAGDRRSELEPNQGVIYGKRLLISESLGPKARAGAALKNNQPKIKAEKTAWMQPAI